MSARLAEDELQENRPDSPTLRGKKAVELNGLIQKTKREELLEGQVQRLTEKVMRRSISPTHPAGGTLRQQHTFVQYSHKIYSAPVPRAEGLYNCILNAANRIYSLLLLPRPEYRSCALFID